MERYQLGAYRCARNTTSGDLLLLIAGATRFKAIFTRAFPGLYFSSTFPDRFGQFSWGTYIKQASAEDEAALNALCALFQEVVCIGDDLDESFALAFHTQTSPAGGYERTRVGQLVREAKPYNRAGSRGDRGRAAELAALLAAFVQRHPTYRGAELLAAVPPSNAEKDFDLPALLAEEIARRTGLGNATAMLHKTRPTRPMKECQTVQEKVDNLKDAFAVDPNAVRGKAMIVVDDVYQSGFSINEVGRVLRQAGARLVLGLTVTKTAHDLSEESVDELA
ncbi:MAG TPA: hypothetical protein VEL76_02925 [Gemmataceae bacterium]|nr:hypothetical protein [Gemmataceae bacterium]